MEASSPGRRSVADAILIGEAADPAVTLHEMIDLIRDEAMRIETVQEVLVSTGTRSRPHPGEMRKLQAFYAAANLLTRIDRHRGAVREALQRSEGAGAGYVRLP